MGAKLYPCYVVDISFTEDRSPGPWALVRWYAGNIYEPPDAPPETTSSVFSAHVVAGYLDAQVGDFVLEELPNSRVSIKSYIDE